MDKQNNKIWDYKSNKDNDKLAKQVSKNPDIVMTKPEMAKYLLNLVNFKDNDIVIEPCKGKGAFYDNLPSNIKKVYCEINEGKDFLKYNKKVDICLSNPPFVPRSLFWDFHLKAMEITKREIYWLINMASLNVFTPNRLKIMNDKGWYIQTFHIVSDKRWYGRYVWVKFTKDKNDLLLFNDKTF